MHKWVERDHVSASFVALLSFFLKNANVGMLLRPIFMVAFQSRAGIFQYPAVDIFFTYVFGDRRGVGHGYHFITFTLSFHSSRQFNTKSDTAFHLTKKWWDLR